MRPACRFGNLGHAREGLLVRPGAEGEEPEAPASYVHRTEAALGNGMLPGLVGKITALRRSGPK